MRRLLAMTVSLAVLWTQTAVADPLLDSLLPGGAGSAAGGTARAEYAPEPALPFDRVSAPEVVVSSSFVTSTTELGGRTVPLLVPAASLPFAFTVDAALAGRFDEDVLRSAIRQWDGIPGSRWATSYGGLVSRVDPSRTDGHSTIFSQQGCPAGVAGYTYPHFATAAPHDRYGDGAWWVSEFDIGICTSVTDASGAGQIIAHEIGHAFGLGHLCDPGQSCWRDGMGAGPHGCRVMYAGRAACPWRIDAREHAGAAHQYPTLQRLAGPSRVETAARVSFATAAERSARQVVLARADRSAHGPLAGAALAGALGGPLLLGVPDPERCVTGTVAQELSRAAAAGAQVALVGDWPQACARALEPWDVEVTFAGGEDPIALGLAVADVLAASRRLGDAVFVVGATDRGGHVPDGIAAGAAAGAARGPVLYTGRDGLDPRVADWLERNDVDTAYVLGGTAVLSAQVVTDLEAVGMAATRVAGVDRVGTALALAAVPGLFDSGGEVVVAAAGDWPDAATGAAYGALRGAPVLLSPAATDARVLAWLRANPRAGGVIVGGTTPLPSTVQADYGRAIAPASAASAHGH